MSHLRKKTDQEVNYPSLTCDKDQACVQGYIKERTLFKNTDNKNAKKEEKEAKLRT